MTDSEPLARLQDEKARLYELLDGDPVAAVADAQKLQVPDAPVELINQVQAMIFIDGGQDSHQYEVVRNGIQLLRAQLEAGTDSPTIKYNLANGLRALVGHSEAQAESLVWLSDTATERRETRRLYQEVADSKDSATPWTLKGMATTNLANLLIRSGRWVEAYEVYRRSLRYDPTNSIASSGAARLLKNLADRNIGEPEILRGLAQKLLRMARQTVASAREHSGGRVDRAVESVQPLECPEWELDLSSLEEIQREAKSVSVRAFATRRRSRASRRSRLRR